MLLSTPINAGTDVELPIIVRQTTKKGVVIPASDFTAAQFNLYTTNREIVLTKTLGSGIVVEDVDGDSLFIVTLANGDTKSFEGLFLLDLVLTDVAGNISIPVQNEVTFKPYLGV